MGLENLRLKLKALRLGRFLTRNRRSKRRPAAAVCNRTWIAPVNHGYHMVADLSYSRNWEEESEHDSVVVQREQMDGIELCFFGVFDTQIGDKVIKFMQTHFFDKNFKQSQVKGKGREAMKKAHVSVRSKVKEAKEGKEAWNMGSSSALVVDGDRLVIATMGNYRAIVCENGLARQISCDQDPTKQRWHRRLMLGMKPRRSSELVVAAKRINSETEFVILGSNGIWEVMKNQEAVNLIRHIEDPQEAAECLAKEAFTRMSKTNISCLVIRFD
ncbi:putative protein phosphatase 2C-like protein 44 [Cucurbita pepo subsp. pepo]|uniref:putative protein phosphatase 2C-like protein 44 n=1 Tax=Cucurbita pepo subsp. pepo TaxID=3664 RepID=UPI000C9D603E|nr:putative protein phosphatase 2C-like protein 44 [Cucurbita pepo subsp. pepo]